MVNWQCYSPFRIPRVEWLDSRSLYHNDGGSQLENDKTMNPNERRNPVSSALLWLPPVVWMIVIFIGSSLPANTINQATQSHHYPISLALAHIGEFAIMSILCHRLIRSFNLSPTGWTWLAVITITLLYGATDELHQMFIPGRVPSFVDLGYDFLGAVVGLAVYEMKTRMLNISKR
ncbi:MAG: VanZ family protein [SAR202 cluster bacterium]|jgi:VanZ family protein|nr:VanZ family protein [SAR202 cluster bacterium]